MTKHCALCKSKDIRFVIWERAEVMHGVLSSTIIEQGSADSYEEYYCADCDADFKRSLGWYRHPVCDDCNEPLRIDGGEYPYQWGFTIESVARTVCEICVDNYPERLGG